MQKIFTLICLFSSLVVIGQDKDDKKKEMPVGAIDNYSAKTFDKILPYQIYQKKLPNDLNVVTIPYDSPGLAAFYIVVRVGSRDEIEEGKTGFAHFFEHMESVTREVKLMLDP